MAYIIKFVGCREPHAVVGTYLRAYDPAAPPDSVNYDGGDLMTTIDPSKAKRFEDQAEAFLFWLTTAPYPFNVRPDGKPNRPLTAFTIELVAV